MIDGPMIRTSVAATGRGRCRLRCSPRAARLRRSRRRTPKIDTGDTAWMLTCTALVLMMTIPGLALFYGGMVRKKNVLATLMQCFTIYLPGHDRLDGRRLLPRLHQRQRLFRRPLARSAARDRGDLGQAVHARRRHRWRDADDDPRDRLHDVPDDLRDHHAGADRRRLRRSHEVLRHAVFMALWSLLVYAPIAHWVWEPTGWLGRRSGVLRFRRRHRRAYQRRHRRPGVRAGARQAASATATTTWRRTTWPTR